MWIELGDRRLDVVELVHYLRVLKVYVRAFMDDVVGRTLEEAERRGDEWPPLKAQE